MHILYATRALLKLRLVSDGAAELLTDPTLLFFETLSIFHGLLVVLLFRPACELLRLAVPGAEGATGPLSDTSPLTALLFLEGL